jgi:hypothetical protein
MDPILLQQFRQQLATWTETRLESQRLPFQRLEICPSTLTDQGCLVPDLVLWINRDSQLAGSMILLPDVVNEKALSAGISLAKALGLGHFTTWAAREVSIWQIISGEPRLLQAFALPPANRITPDDFQQTLDDLLAQLKVVTVTSAPPSASYSAHYFANLCLRNLQELSPGLTTSARLTAGQTATNDWVELAPREKAWMSLWRILFLLWGRRLPPGLQPERLERAIRYALADLTVEQLKWLDFHDSEPPLSEEDAVRLHHLASRLRQLGWPHNDDHATTLIGLLLNEAAHRFDVEAPLLPWETKGVDLCVYCHPPESLDTCSLIAPRAFLAGWAFNSSLRGQVKEEIYAEGLQALNTGQQLSSALAVLQEAQPPGRKERDASLILLRQVWPSRRFDLRHNAPAWLWDALYLTGLVSEELSLVLPQGWHRTPGILNLWTTLAERYRLVEISELATGQQSLHFIQAADETTFVRVYRNQQTIDIPYDLLVTQNPGTTQAWLKASDQVVELLLNNMMTVITPLWLEEPEPPIWGLFLYLQTRLGRYLWDLCSDQGPLPGFEIATGTALALGLPVPNEAILSDLGLIGAAETRTVPDTDQLEREFANIFGPTPDLPESSVQAVTAAPRARRRSCLPSDQITAKVFQDGRPLFPEHYLMDSYRPELAHYDLFGPLELSAEFFDRMTLRTIDMEHTIEVSGKNLAEALILASSAGRAKVSLPTDEHLLEKILLRYQSDLELLWNNLARECRRCEPHRQAAINLARKIWQQQGLPPADGRKTD